MARILIVEDDESIRNLIELTLMQFQYETVSFEDAETAWEYLKKNSADMGIFDLMLPGMTGLELIARIREDEHLSGLPVIILTAKDSETHNFNEEGLNIDFDGRTVHVREQQVDLTYKEFELLKYLISHKGKAVSRQELLNQIWGYDFVGESRTLDVHINSLRRKLGEPYDGWIQVIRGVGYRFVQESNT